VVLGNWDVCRTIAGVGEDSKIHGLVIDWIPVP